MIEVSHLSRDFKLQKPRKGLKGYIVNLFNPQFDIKHAVCDVSFDIEQGECVGYIGSNGAGKSTTIKMLCGILVPTDGTIRVDGIIPSDNRKEYCKNIGVVFGQRSQLWWDIPITETFELLRQMYQIKDSVYKNNMSLFYDILGLGEFENMSVRQLSLGQKMRADFACAMLHNPRILYLDEPTIGLDVLAKEKIRSFVREVNAEKKVSIILTTHDMHDVEELCERVIAIDKGRVFFDGKLVEIVEMYTKSSKLRVRCSSNMDFSADEAIPGVVGIETGDDGAITLEFDPKSVTAMKILDIVRSRHDVVDFRLLENDIDSIVRSMYRSIEKGA